MKRVKQMASFLLAAAIIGTSISPVVANAAVKDKVSNKSGVVDLSKASKGGKISKALTYSQLVNEVAKNEKLSIPEAKAFLGSNSNIQLDDEEYKYRTYTEDVRITYEYTVELHFYCKTSEGGGFRGIVQVLNSSMNRHDSDTDLTKGFSGTLYVNLQRGDDIYYELNGDFLNNETTTHSGGVAIGVGEGTSINFSSSSSSNEYQYVDVTDHYRLY